ncbi:hypothetical protein [Azospirillum endophyticum]
MEQGAWETIPRALFFDGFLWRLPLAAGRAGYGWLLAVVCRVVAG